MPRDTNGKGVIFNTITISDGISMGSEGMKYSLVSREVVFLYPKYTIGYSTKNLGIDYTFR
jgi:dihydroxyacid dehydratase/phosphogluconate dehydratase